LLDARPAGQQSLRPAGPKTEVQRAKMGGVLGEGTFASPPALGEQCKLFSGGWGEAPATCYIVRP